MTKIRTTAALYFPYALVALVVLLAMHDRQSAIAANPPTAIQLMSGQHLCGVYRGVVESTTDPEHKSRVQIRVPQVNVNGLWALPGSLGLPPVVGSQVWILFEAGSVERPVWFGSVPPSV